MKIKPVLALAAALGAPLLFGHAAQAQTNPVPVIVPHRLEQLAAKLNLTPQQQAQAQVVLAQARQQKLAIAADTNLTATQKRQSERRLGASTLRKLSALLTPDQRHEARQLLRQRLNRLADKIGVTTVQRSQIKTLIADGRAQAKAVRANTALTAAQKKTQLRAIFKGTRKQVLGILTPTQRHELSNMAAARKAKRLQSAG